MIGGLGARGKPVLFQPGLLVTPVEHPLQREDSDLSVTGDEPRSRGSALLPCPPSFLEHGFGDWAVLLVEIVEACAELLTFELVCNGAANKAGYAPGPDAPADGCDQIWRNGD